MILYISAVMNILRNICEASVTTRLHRMDQDSSGFAYEC